MDATELGDAVNAFIRLGETYLSRKQIERLKEGLLHRAAHPQHGSICRDEIERIGRELLEHNGETNQGAADIREAAPALARNLESAGIDSTPVLKVLHCANRGGGAQALAVIWGDVKVELQRIAIGFRAGKMVGKKIGRKERRPQHRPLTDRQREVMETLARHDGDSKSASEELGISRQAVESHRDVTLEKIPEIAQRVNRTRARKTRRLPEDRRGQPDVPVETDD